MLSLWRIARAHELRYGNLGDCGRQNDRCGHNLAG